MRLQVVTLLTFSALLTGCGDDQAKSRSGSTAKNPTIQGATGSESSVFSGVVRERGMPQIKYATEAATTSAAYRFIPDMASDTEAGLNLSVNTLGRPNILCGIDSSLSSMSARIADCATKNSNKSTWSAQADGTASEADWKLVAYLGTNQEIWQDQRTKAIWSHVVAKGNWCQATGNNQSPTGNITVDCALSIPADADDSLCVGLEIKGLTDAIKWRLPTRADFLQADVDGLKSVLSTTDLDTNGLWTATLDSSDSSRSKAWVYTQKQGTLSSDLLLSTHQVRCIGVAK